MSPSLGLQELAPTLPALMVCVLTAACGADARPAESVERDAGRAEIDAGPRVSELIDQSAWRDYPTALDPLPAHQPEHIACSVAGWFIERGSLEVNTADCNYLLVENPARRALARGAEVALEIVHFDLDAPEPASAHVALFFADALQWELEVPIPSYAYVHKETFRATRALAEGEPIRLHLHNHGQNAWLFTSLRAEER